VVLLLKKKSNQFPTKEGVGVVKGDQRAVRQCYNTTLKSLPEKASFREKSKEDGK
jgi:hypothetical protein